MVLDNEAPWVIYKKRKGIFVIKFGGLKRIHGCPSSNLRKILMKDSKLHKKGCRKLRSILMNTHFPDSLDSNEVLNCKYVRIDLIKWIENMLT